MATETESRISIRPLGSVRCHCGFRSSRRVNEAVGDANLEEEGGRGGEAGGGRPMR